jgi:cytochrome c-type biogenesis protein CcmE
MTRKQRRLVLIGSSLAVLALAVGLVLSALRDSIVFFNSPSDIAGKSASISGRIRMGGLVEPGSIDRGPELRITFKVTDGNAAIPVSYRGMLPDLFREGQGVVVDGRYANGVFTADNVLAKHDERYMPREVVDALKKTGRWQEEEGKGHAR